ncbi:hypothetical protein HD806DRAFT_541443 [Xylariaceae sp. AK1471]|nr:hypothetical protein HD806DRAFT_541443 [Xylariaceae sp. AK1471]
MDATGDGIPELAHLKTRNTGSNSVEVRIASASSQYQDRILALTTTFTKEECGAWLLAPTRYGDRGLLTSCTSRRIERHRVSSRFMLRLSLLVIARGASRAGARSAIKRRMEHGV